MVEKKQSLWDELGDYPKVERHIATPEELAEHWDFVARSRRLKSEMRAELLKKYPDKFVGITRGGNLVVGDSMEELVAQADELGERGNMAWDFLNTKPMARVVIR